MQKTYQNALFQAINQGYVNIRQMEVNYYSSFFNCFGGQAAVIGGFAYAVRLALVVLYYSYHIFGIYYFYIRH